MQIKTNLERPKFTSWTAFSLHPQHWRRAHFHSRNEHHLQNDNPSGLPFQLDLTKVHPFGTKHPLQPKAGLVRNQNYLCLSKTRACHCHWLQLLHKNFQPGFIQVEGDVEDGRIWTWGHVQHWWKAGYYCVHWKWQCEWKSFVPGKEILCCLTLQCFFLFYKILENFLQFSFFCCYNFKFFWYPPQ